jgi:release factor glutamine methyltransferase
MLARAGVPDAGLDAALLLEGLLGVPRLSLFSRGDEALDTGTVSGYRAWTARRARREPLQYILGEAAFMGRVFVCCPGVLIPRADSEAMCARAVETAGENARALDLCCGTGCLGLSLKLDRPDAAVTLSDLSAQACALARENAARLGAAAEVVQGDFFAPFAGRVFDLILCNPPYIPTGELPCLQPEVGFEPPLALNGGADGLSFYRRLAAEAAAFLAPGGVLLVETGDGQAEAAAGLFVAPFAPPKVRPDLTGNPRFLEIRRAGG